MIRKIFLFDQKLTEILEIKDNKIINRLKNVLRLKPGERIFFLNNFEEEAEYEILDNKKWILKRVGYKIRELKPQRKINLFISLIRKEKFELIIEKGTELGVYSFYPLITERSPLKIKKIPERWKQIIGSALEVTNWQNTPLIYQPINLKDLFQKFPSTNFYTGDKNGEKIKINYLPQEVNLIIGPEGGFSERELKILKEKTKFISLGDLNLRTETAVLVFLSLLNFG